MSVLTCPVCGTSVNIQDVDVETKGASCPRCNEPLAAPKPAKAPVPRPGRLNRQTGSASSTIQTIKVSAHVISWPDCCACCMGEADGAYTATNTRTTGKRVIHHTTSSWKVPCCESCLAHAEWAVAARRAFRMWIAVALVLFCVAFCGGVGFSGRPAAVALTIFLGFLALGFVALAVVMRVRRMDMARQTQTPYCCGMGRPVRYMGWHGSVHSFTFQNRQYAERFAHLNSSKLVW